MSTHPPSASRQRLVAGQTSIHRELLEQLTPDWLIDATPQRRAAMKASGSLAPHWYTRASIEQQQALKDRFTDSLVSQTRLDKTMSSLPDAESFAEPILQKALKDQFGVEADVNKTMVCLRRALEISELEIEISSFEVISFRCCRRHCITSKHPNARRAPFIASQGLWLRLPRLVHSRSLPSTSRSGNSSHSAASSISARSIKPV